MDLNSFYLMRRCTSADVGQVRALRFLGLQESPEAFGSSYEEEQQQSDQEWAVRIDTQYSENRSVVLGAWKDHLLIGMLGLRRFSQIKLAHKAVIWGMYVHPDARGQGIARKLISEAIRLAKEMPGLLQVSLSVVPTQEAAYCLYTSCGFEEYGFEQAALKVGVQLLDESHMVLKLS